MPRNIVPAMFGGDSSEMQWCSTCRIEHERWVMKCVVVNGSRPGDPTATSPHDAIEIDVADLDPHGWALLDMLLDGSGIRYVLDGPVLAVPSRRVADVASIVDAVRAEAA